MNFYNLYLLFAFARDGYLSHLYALLLETVPVKTQFIYADSEQPSQHTVSGHHWPAFETPFVSLEGR